MGCKCWVVGCKSGYNSEKSAGISVFHFPLHKKELCATWERFVNRANWKPTRFSVVCANHFEEKFLTIGKRTTLRWSLKPVPTVMTAIQLKHSSTIPTKLSVRKPPKNRSIQRDELKDFVEKDKIFSFEEVDESLAPPNYMFYKSGNKFVVYYSMCYEGFPKVINAIKITKSLKVQLQRNGANVPLPKWLKKSCYGVIIRKSMLINLPTYLDSLDSGVEGEPDLIDEMHNMRYNKAKGHPAFSPKMIRYCLLLRYASAQAYRILLDILPMPSISYLRSLTKGSLESSAALKLLKDKGEISRDLILMVDEMYLQKSVQYNGGMYLGANEKGNL